MNKSNPFSKAEIIVLVIVVIIIINLPSRFKDILKKTTQEVAESKTTEKVVEAKETRLENKNIIELNLKIEIMERFLLNLAVNVEELKNQIQQQESSKYIYIEDAIVKYKVCRTTIQKKVNKYKIEKQKRGKRTLVDEMQLIAALEKKEPKPNFNRSKEA